MKQYHLTDAFEITKFINRRIKSKIKRKDNFTYFNEAYYMQWKRGEKELPI